MGQANDLHRRVLLSWNAIHQCGLEHRGLSVNWDVGFYVGMTIVITVY